MTRSRLYFSTSVFILLLIITISFLLRFYKLTSIPPGLGRDEVSVAYNAYSILLTGRDEYQRFLPVYFEAIGDQKLPVIIYLTAVSIKLFGLNEFGARFPFALLGSLTIIFVYLLVRKTASFFKKIPTVPLALLSSFLLAINPWHIAHSRAVYEIVLGTFFFTAGFYSFLCGLTSKKWFIFSITVFIIAFYTYSMARLLSPALFIYLCFVFKDEIKKYSGKFLTCAFSWGVFLLIPFFLTFFEAGGISGPKGAVILTSSITRSAILEFRSYLAPTQASFLGPIFFNRIIMIFYEYLKNILSSLSLKFYFVEGSHMAGVGTNGQFYLIEVIPFFVGLVLAIQETVKRDKFFKMLLGWIVLTILSASLTVNPPYSTRTLFMVVPVLVITAVGWLKIFSLLTKCKFYFRVLLLVFITAYIWHTSYYFISYYFRSPIVYAENWEAKAKELFGYLERVEDKIDHIVITKPEKSMYAFLLFYRKIPPWETWSKLERYGSDADGWRHGKKFGKYEFRGIDWWKDLQTKKRAILVAHGGEYPDRQVVSKEIYYSERHIVFPNGQQIISFPEKKVAYRIWFLNIKDEESIK